ncbi:puff-specific protein Bx42 isoform X2 [Arctopsyche grandis]|uniref:puff-specific protein Bx42 isoform X2 n=1 Tax=Arctopsyche grandis TaxID=121162 RepID=UPI00406D754E
MAMALSSILPAPSQAVWDREDERRSLAAQRATTTLLVTQSSVPPYGQRKGWVPRAEPDFGDGGAFPEILVAQHPLGMGQHTRDTPALSSKGGVLSVRLDETGKIKYDAIVRQGHSKDKIIYSKLSDLLPAEVLAEDDPTLEKPDDEEIQETTEKTRQALEKLTSSKISAAMPVRCVEKSAPAQYIRYTPAQQGAAFNSGAKQRVIRMVEAQIDPMEPPKFAISRKIPRGAPSPPAPVLHSPPRRVSVRQQRDWKVPPCVSHWKNAKGYTIPLDKRLAADGRGLQQVHINENFSKLAEALYIADRKAREAVEARAQLEKKLAQREKEKKEDHLRMMAQKARDHRNDLENVPLPGAAVEGGADMGEEERERLRAERHKERQRDRNIARAAPDKRSKLVKERERDISEQIALGLPAKTNLSGEGMFDQRLFNTSKGMDSGFADDEAYNVYDKPWRDQNSLGTHLYRPTKNIDKDNYGGDLETIIKTNRFVPDKEFSGTEKWAGQQSRAGPVQFERDVDPFGLDRFLSTVKRADKVPNPPPAPAPSSSGRKRDHYQDHGHSNKKGRRD